MRNVIKAATLLITVTVILMSFTITEIYASSIGVILDDKQVVFTSDSGQPFIDKVLSDRLSSGQTANCFLPDS